MFGHQAVGVQLRVALPRGAMHEPGHHPPVRRRRGGGPRRSASGPVAACSSKNPSAAATASRWAVITVSATGSEPSAHNSDTDFGAENVRSNAFTVRSRNPTSNGTPDTGWLPSIKGAQLRRLRPCPPDPGRVTSRPIHTPGASPTAGVVLVDPQRHRRQQVLAVGQRRHRQHDPPPDRKIATDTCQPSGQANPRRSRSPRPEVEGLL